MPKDPATVATDQDVTIVSFPEAAREPSAVEAARLWLAEHFLRSTAGAQRLVVDLRGVSALDSAALGPLIQRLRDLQGRRGRMAVVGVDAPALREIFALTRFDQVFQMFASLPEAIQAVREGPTARFSRR